MEGCKAGFPEKNVFGSKKITNGAMSLNVGRFILLL
jgi:hypothetical protein